MDLKTLQKRIDKLNLNNLFKKIFNLRDVKDFVIKRNQEHHTKIRREFDDCV